MYLFHQKLFIFLSLLLSHNIATASSYEGDYERVPAGQFQSGILKISQVSGQHALINLQVEWNPSSTGDGGFIRNGVVENGEVSIVGNVGLYEPSEDEIKPCKIVFVFTAKFVDVSQFGTCSWFGEGVIANGRYVRLSSRSKVR